MTEWMNFGRSGVVVSRNMKMGNLMFYAVKIASNSVLCSRVVPNNIQDREKVNFPRIERNISFQSSFPTKSDILDLE